MKCRHDVFGDIVHDRDFDFDLGDEMVFIFHAAVDLCMTSLTAKALHLTHHHPGHAFGKTKAARLGLPCLIYSIIIQVNDTTAAEIWVTTMAIAALPFAPSALLPLKPNQPTHSIAAPIMTYPGLCDGVLSLGNPLRLTTRRR